MKKGSPSLSPVEKVTLRPTEMGVHVIERLKRPGTDKSAMLRHLIELGYACEQAGFILDGSTLRHAGSTWHVQPNFGAAVAQQARENGPEQAGAAQPARRTRAPAEASMPQQNDTGAAEDAGNSHEPAQQAGTGGGLAARLRGLSG